jgi:hypothetical protein
LSISFDRKPEYLQGRLIAKRLLIAPLIEELHCAPIAAPSRRASVLTCKCPVTGGEACFSGGLVARFRVLSLKPIAVQAFDNEAGPAHKPALEAGCPSRAHRGAA